MLEGELEEARARVVDAGEEQVSRLVVDAKLMWRVAGGLWNADLLQGAARPEA